MGQKIFILAIDQGTSSTKAIVYDKNGRAIARGSVALETKHFPNGFVEQDPEGIYRNVLDSVRQCIVDYSRQGNDLAQIASCGISNQRETFLLWDKTGKPVSPAVVWACKRSTGICKELKEQGHEATIRQKTGLIIDPYFSATKLLWLLENDPLLQKRVQAGEIAFGTVDCWLLYRLTGGRQFRTDHTNACRTLLFNIHTLEWDREILELWGLGALRLPEVFPSASDYGQSDFEGLFPEPLPILSLIGDSHAATFGEGCFEPGMAKVTLGTGSSIMMNIGKKPLDSAHGLLTTIGWSLPGRVDYALEGAIVACGSTLEWLKKELHLFEDPRETEKLAMSVPDNAGVYLVPAFSGLGAPHWQMNRKASLEGLTFGTTKEHIVRAALESIPYQIKDVMRAMRQDLKAPLREMAVNGGIAQNSFVIRFLADLLQIKLRKSEDADVSAKGAAFLAGLQNGLYPSLEQLAKWNRERSETISPDPDQKQKMDNCYLGWQQFINR